MDMKHARFLIVLCALLLLCLLPTTAGAADYADIWIDVDTENTYWSIDANGWASKHIDQPVTGGWVHYAKASGDTPATLTLNNAHLKNKAGLAVIYVLDVSPLSVVLIGENTITYDDNGNNEPFMVASSSKHGVTIQGQGTGASLAITNDAYSIAFHVTDNLTVRNCSITATNTNVPDAARVDSADMTIDGASFKAENKYNTYASGLVVEAFSWSMNGVRTVEGGIVTVINGGVLEAKGPRYGLYVGYGDLIMSGKDSRITGAATGGGSDACGIYVYETDDLTYGNINVNGGTIIGEGGRYGIYAEQNINFQGNRMEASAKPETVAAKRFSIFSTAYATEPIDLLAIVAGEKLTLGAAGNLPVVTGAKKPYFASNQTSGDVIDGILLQAKENTRVVVQTPGGLVKFNPNDGTGTMEDIVVLRNAQYTLPASTFTPPAGMKFKAWAYNNPDGDQFPIGQKIMLEADVTFYAIWEVDPGGGVIPPVVPPDVPKTGDSANYALWVGMLALGVAGVAALVVARKKRKA